MAGELLADRVADPAGPLEKVPRPFADNLDFLSALEAEHVALAELRWAQGAFPREGRREKQAEPGDPGILARRHGALREANRLRLQASGGTFPLDELALRYGLDPFEREVVALLFSAASGNAFRRIGRERLCLASYGDLEIGQLLALLCADPREALVRRRHFSVSAPLVAQGLVDLSGRREDEEVTNVLCQEASLKPRFVNFILGDANQYAAISSHVVRERPALSWDRVVLPAGLKDQVKALISGFPDFLQRLRETGLEETVGYGLGLTLLFHGPSGTGKTMLARAVASYLGCELMTLDISRLAVARNIEAGVRHFLREARLSGAVAFFDECETLFQSETQAARSILVELEKTPCLAILATNHADRLEPALERRIALKVAFGLPGAAARLEIWRQLMPPGVALAEDVDLDRLARAYPCPGGGIKSILCMAVQAAAQRAGSPLTLRQADIEAAADAHLQGGFDPVWRFRSPAGRAGDAAPAEGVPELVRLERLLSARFGGGGGGERPLGILVRAGAVAQAVAGLEDIAARLGIGWAVLRLEDLPGFGSQAPKEGKAAESRGKSGLFGHPLLGGRLCLVADPKGRVDAWLGNPPDLEAPEADLVASLEAFPGTAIVVTVPGRTHPAQRGRWFRIETALPPVGAGERLRAWEAERARGRRFERKDLAPYAARNPAPEQVPELAYLAWLHSHAEGDAGLIRDAHVEAALQAMRPAPAAPCPVLFGG